METKMKLIWIVALTFGLTLGEAKADDWIGLPGVSSASLAKAQGWRLAGTTAMSWPDGRQAIVTFWERCYEKPSDNTDGLCFTQRCIDYFDEAMSQTGSYCKSAQ
jgi:hypothetical protein